MSPKLYTTWDFTTGSLRSSGVVAIDLVPQSGSCEWSPSSGLRVKEGQWLKAADSESLRVDGPFRLCAEIRRSPKSTGYCEAIAGIWDEQLGQRQYALFLSAMDARDCVVGHISATGGNAHGHDHCRSAAVGTRQLTYDIWHHVELYWDGTTAGVLVDQQPDGLPFPIRGPLFTSDAEFTVGAVARKRPPAGIGNFFVGDVRRIQLYR